MYTNVNEKLNGLGSGLTPSDVMIGGNAMTPTDTTAPTTDCPCECQEGITEEIFYINEVDSPGSIPFNLTQKKVDCTPPVSKPVYDPKCPDIVEALKTQYPGNIQGVHGLGNCGCGCSGERSNGFSGLGMTTDENATGGGVVTPIDKSGQSVLTEEEKPNWKKAGAWYLGIGALGILLGKYFFGKHSK
jgi:hypothetical protein